MYIALYLPAKSPSEPDPSRKGFATEKEAEDYMVSNMCETCKEEREIFFKGKKSKEYKKFVKNGSENWEPCEYPPCSCEWSVRKESEYEKNFLSKIKNIGE